MSVSKILLILVMGFFHFSGQSWAQANLPAYLGCTRDLATFEERKITAEKMLGQNKLQEAAWVYIQNGQNNEAQKTLKNLESNLKFGTIESRGPLGGGVSETQLIKFTSGIKAVFKPEGKTQYIETEIAVYKLDQLMAINQVPMTVERTIEGQRGSLQYFIKDANMARDVGTPIPNPKMALFDFLIANRDRSIRNYLILKDKTLSAHRHGRTDQVAIDHNLALIIKKPEIGYFGDSNDLASAGKPFCQKLKSLKDKFLIKELNDILSPFQMKMLLENKKKLLKGACKQYAKVKECIQH